jgi:hypothetical protein
MVASESACAQETALDAQTPIVLRPTDELRRLAERIAEILEVRIDPDVSVGEAPPPEVIEAVPAGHVAMVREEREIVLVIAVPSGHTFDTRVAVRSLRSSESARTLAIAIEVLRDTALEGAPDVDHGIYTREGNDYAWTFREAHSGFFGPRQRIEADAKPLVTLGLFGAISTQRATPSIGPRVGLGLCLGDYCMLFEGDLPIADEGAEACDHRRIAYRAVTLAMRGQLRPIRYDWFSASLNAGVLTRFGLATTDGTDANRVATSFGVRVGLETAFRVSGAFELVAEIGADFAVSPARFIRTPIFDPSCGDLAEVLFVEDVATLWLMIAARLRP